MSLRTAIRRIGRRLSRANVLAISRPIPLKGGGYIVATATSKGITRHRAETLEDAKSYRQSILAGLNTGAVRSSIPEDNPRIDAGELPRGLEHMFRASFRPGVQLSFREQTFGVDWAVSVDGAIPRWRHSNTARATPARPRRSCPRPNTGNCGTRPHALADSHAAAARDTCSRPTLPGSRRAGGPAVSSPRTSRRSKCPSTRATSGSRSRRTCCS